MYLNINNIIGFDFFFLVKLKSNINKIKDIGIVNVI